MRRGRPPYPAVLTPREQEVLALIRDGLTNEQIATRLGISESGARYHVSEILSKLGVTSRHEAAGWDGAAQPRKLPVLAWLRLIAAATLLVAVLAGIALAIGVIVMRDRGGASPTAEQQHEEASLVSFLGLAIEAYLEAQAAMPTAVLFQVNYSLSTGLYTFRFTEPTPMHEAQVIGPNAPPGQPRWWHQQSSFANLEGAQLRPIDLADVRSSPVEVGDIVSRSRRVDQVVLTTRGDELQWAIIVSGQGLLCGLSDGQPVSQITCQQP